VDVDPDFSDIVVYNCSSFFHRFSIVVKLRIFFDCAIYYDDAAVQCSSSPLELHLTTSELWFGQEQEAILP